MRFSFLYFCLSQCGKSTYIYIIIFLSIYMFYLFYLLLLLEILKWCDFCIWQSSLGLYSVNIFDLIKYTSFFKAKRNFTHDATFKHWFEKMVVYNRFLKHIWKIWIPYDSRGQTGLFKNITEFNILFLKHLNLFDKTTSNSDNSMFPIQHVL